MDPLSIFTSIAALLQITSSFLKYLNGVKGASEDRGRILSELANGNSILLILRDQAYQARYGEGSALTLQSLDPSLELSKEPLEQLRSTLERLAAKIAPPATLIRKLGRAMIWPFQKEEVQDILRSIERQKALLILGSQNDHMQDIPLPSQFSIALKLITYFV